jgi:hypothetical protein
MKPPLRGKYLVTEHAVELRRIISALPIVLADVGAVRYQGGFATACAPDRQAHSQWGCVIRSQGGERRSSLSAFRLLEDKTWHEDLRRSVPK